MKKLREFRKAFPDSGLMIYYSAVYEMHESGREELTVTGRIERPLFHPLQSPDWIFGMEQETDELVAIIEELIDSDFERFEDGDAAIAKMVLEH